MGSYRDIMRAPELQAEYEKFQAYKRKSREEKQSLYKGLNVNKTTYAVEVQWIAPFAQPAKNLFVLIENPNGTGVPIPAARKFIANHFETTAPEGAAITIVSNRKIFPKGKLAKLVVKQRGNLRQDEHKSRITGREYKRYESNSVSVTFGKAAAADDYSDAVKAITSDNDYKAFVKTTGNTVRFVPEG